jgi:hypothetical protein
VKKPTNAQSAKKAFTLLRNIRSISSQLAVSHQRMTRRKFMIVSNATNASLMGTSWRNT